MPGHVAWTNIILLYVVRDDCFVGDHSHGVWDAELVQEQEQGGGRGDLLIGLQRGSVQQHVQRRKVTNKCC